MRLQLQTTQLTDKPKVLNSSQMDGFTNGQERLPQYSIFSNRWFQRQVETNRAVFYVVVLVFVLIFLSFWSVFLVSFPPGLCRPLRFSPGHALIVYILINPGLNVKPQLTTRTMGTFEFFTTSKEKKV